MQPRLILKNPIFHLFYDLGKIGKSSPEHNSNFPMFNIFANWENSQCKTMDENWKKLCPNLNFNVENKIGNLHEIRLFKLRKHYLKFKNSSKNWEKYIFHWQELNFEDIGNSVHITPFWH